MANYNKSFNFRNGVQVDDDNLVVDTLGKVGIGTTVPTEFLDVRGNATVSGFTTASDVYSKNVKVSGILTASTLTDGKITISSGIITASSGVVTFYGDGRGIVNIPTSQWVDIDVGLGFTSIYNTGFVGVNTNDPRYAFQVAGTNDLSNFVGGVGINSRGDIVATGVITATTVRAALGATFLTGTIDNARIPSNINVSGVITATGGFVGDVVGIASTARSLTGSPSITVTNISAGIITATSINSAGLVTATGVNLTGNAVIGGFVSAASTITSGSITVTGNTSVSGILTAASVNSGVSTVGVATIHNQLHVGTSGTFFAVTSDGKIGIGSASPTSEVLVRKEGTTLVEVISDTGESRISIGQSVGVGNSSAILRFGNTRSTFDILNRSVGGFNNYIHAGGSGIGTGNFNWIYGQTNAELMTLTYGGRLGLGKTNPDNTLHVVGTSTVTGNAWFGSNVTITGTLSAGTFSLPSVITDTNINSSSGVSTFADLDVTDNLYVNTSIGVGTVASVGVGIDARNKTALFGTGVGIGTNTSSVDAALLVVGQSRFDSIGVGTTGTNGVGFKLYGDFEQYGNRMSLDSTVLVVFNNAAVGVGTSIPRSAVDFADAGKTSAGVGKSAYMIPPRITTTDRVGLTTLAGALIFNTSSSEFQGYLGSSWTTIGITTANIVSDQIKVGTGVTINSGVVTAVTAVHVGTGVTIRSGIVTAIGGFTSGIGTEVKITTSGNRLIFTVPGVGTTSLQLF